MNLKNNLFSILAISFLFSLTDSSMAKSICETNKTCSQDQFAAESMWIAQEFLDTKSELTSLEKLDLKSCLLMMIGESTHRIFNDRKSLSAVQYKKALTGITKKFQDLPDLYQQCPTKNISYDDFVDIFSKSLTTQRAKTDFNDFRASPGSYKEQTVRISGYGQYALDSFMLKSDPSDLNPIIVDLTSTSRAGHSNIIKLCGNAKRLCKVTVLARYESSYPIITVTASGPMEFH